MKLVMMNSDVELRITQDRISHMQAQVARLRTAEVDPRMYHASASGFFAEIDRMQLEVREYLSLHPTEIIA